MISDLNHPMNKSTERSFDLVSQFKPSVCAEVISNKMRAKMYTE